MVTLHIEHSITDFDVWKAAFDRFAEVRAESGVRGHCVLRPVDDECSVVVDLNFQTVDEAKKFLHFLKTMVWASADAAPALVGTPHARILKLAEAS